MTEEMILDRDELRLWFATKEPDEIVGLRQESDACPLAVYFCEMLGYQHASVDEVGIQAFNLGESRFLSFTSPEWARAFVRRIDAFDGCISAKQALTILDSV